VIRSIGAEACGDTGQPKEKFGKHPEIRFVEFQPIVLPSSADLDTYIAMADEEEKIRGLTSK
jgi:hypothetical protein